MAEEGVGGRGEAGGRGGLGESTLYLEYFYV